MLNLKKQIEAYGREDLVIRTRLESDIYPTNYNCTFLATPRAIEFTKPKIKITVKKCRTPNTYAISLSSDAIAYQVYLNLGEAIEHRMSDNFIDCFPGETHTITVRPKLAMTAKQVKQELRILSYRDSYLA